MKKKYKKVIVLEVCCLLIAVFYMPWAIISDAYIQANTIPKRSCSNFISDTNNPPCRVDNPIAKQLVGLREEYNKFGNSPVGSFWGDLPNQTANLFAGGRMALVISDIFQVAYNLLALNVLFFVGYQIKIGLQ